LYEYDLFVIPEPTFSVRKSAHTSLTTLKPHHRLKWTVTIQLPK